MRCEPVKKPVTRRWGEPELRAAKAREALAHAGGRVCWATAHSRRGAGEAAVQCHR